MSNYALIFASGVGSRMRSTIGPKQFMKIGDKEILAYTLEIFANHKEIDGIYVVVREGKEDFTQSIIDKFSIGKVKKVVTGDESSAHGSIINGLAAMKDDGIEDSDVVLVHDGVRPILDVITISKCISSTKEFGNAITCMPAQETVAYKGEDDTIKAVTKREEMIILQAPQAFRFKDAHNINERAKKDGIVGKVVDQAELNRRYGTKLHIIEGLKGNVKITVPLDFMYFEYLVHSGKHATIIKGENPW